MPQSRRCHRRSSCLSPPRLPAPKTADIVGGFFSVTDTYLSPPTAIVATMQSAIGAHIIKTAFGQWLPGDPRGSWSAAWSPQLGHHAPHTLHPGDRVRHQQAADRMKHPPTVWPGPIRNTIASAIRDCADQSHWSVAALAIEPTHFHLLITPPPTNLDATGKWLAQQITKAARNEHEHPNPLFARGKWAGVITEDTHWQNAVAYINRHPHAQNRGGHPRR